MKVALNLIQRNLSYAQKPVKLSEQLRAQQESFFAQQQFEMQQALYEQQMDILRAQQQAAQLRQHVEEQRQQNRQTPVQAREVKNLPSAKYGGENLWSKLESGAMLGDAEMKQLFLSIDVQEHSSKDRAEKFQAQALRSYAIQKLAQNSVVQAERDEEGSIILQGIPVRPEDALSFALQDIEHFEQTDTHLGPAQLLALKEKYFDLNELQRIYERSNQIIHESHNQGDKRAVDYFANTANKSTGNNSLMLPRQIDNPGTLEYYEHGFFGQGQDLQIDIANLAIRSGNDELRKAFLGDAEYKPDADKPNPFPTILSEFRKDGRPREVLIPQVKLPTKNKGWQENSIGKVKLEAYGLLIQNSKRRPVFVGTLRQGRNAEVFTFPSGNRTFNKEMKTWIGRHLLPLTVFRTIIVGEQPITVEF